MLLRLDNPPRNILSKRTVSPSKDALHREGIMLPSKPTAYIFSEIKKLFRNVLWFAYRFIGSVSS